MYCVLADRLDCAEALLKAGASVNKTDHSQRTALHLTAHKVRCRHTQTKFTHTTRAHEHINTIRDTLVPQWPTKDPQLIIIIPFLKK
jgi:ankyrin repeat protein